jgi:hypothetical protein
MAPARQTPPQPNLGDTPAEDKFLYPLLWEINVMKIRLLSCTSCYVFCWLLEHSSSFGYNSFQCYNLCVVEWLLILSSFILRNDCWKYGGQHEQNAQYFLRHWAKCLIQHLSLPEIRVTVTASSPPHLWHLLAIHVTLVHAEQIKSFRASVSTKCH